ncbi:amidohydrolase family protein [Gordonia terrae]|uniref:Amidohydrolase n=2 Tax=Gordonia terrae TaxID=2055 RepID=A0AAD0NWE7_9ACTN|nr:amidohydrolase family protein [Gordonia terrae]VTR09151.1 Predicted metal-dependent hydrolase of the TIM-barrel fold [Clostridioides difficile]ANY21835.1 amidohydrolase [Gordonia terrae]AWO82568.1 amidohydrolase [Gordonia terrae]VTS21957.1 Predicted metal-dependent hydrolase of the TIM-barrel fold [Gordonia terrae]GAB44773.1 putative hydrolase [Gordonia terrae NBRC 100016]
MPLEDHVQLVSVDDHLIERPNVWQDRLPTRFREAGPRIIESTGTEKDQYGFGQSVSKGRQVWTLEGKVYAQLGLNAVAGKPRDQVGTDPVRFEEMIPGCYDPKARVLDMDVDGVQAAMLFPSFPRFAGTLFGTLDDRELARQCVMAWNDYVLEEWCAAYPDRFIPMVILPFWDLDQALAELDRVADHNIRAISFPENPSKLGHPSLHSNHWDPLWARLQEAGIVVCLHFGTSGQVTLTSDDAPMAVMTTLMGTNSMAAMADLLYSPMLHKFPSLKVSLSEGGVGWVPWLLERADQVWERHRFYQNINQEVPPSEIFRRNIWGCFIVDQFGVDNRHAIGIDRLTWECDYPHSDSYWPNSRKIVSEMFDKVPSPEVEQIVEMNARELFRFPRL